VTAAANNKSTITTAPMENLDALLAVKGVAAAEERLIQNGTDKVGYVDERGEGGGGNQQGEEGHGNNQGAIQNPQNALAVVNTHLALPPPSLQHQLLPQSHPLLHRSVSFEGDQPNNVNIVGRSLVHGSTAAATMMNDGAEMGDEEQEDEDVEDVDDEEEEEEEEEDTNAGGGGGGGGADEQTSGSRSAALSSGRGNDFFSGEGGRPDLSSGI